MENTQFIKLSPSLGLKINEILKSKLNFTPRTNQMGILSFEFTKSELELIDTLEFINPVEGDLEGIEYFPNLKTLTIESFNNSYYNLEKNIASISGQDAKSISKCTHLTSLTIKNQAKLSYVDISKLKHLHFLSLTNNITLEEVYGLNQLTDLWTLECVGNEVLMAIEELSKVIIDNTNLIDLKLDILLFSDAIEYKNDQTFNKTALEKILDLNASWEETLRGNKKIKINNAQMIQMHNKACQALTQYVPQHADKKTIVIGIEKFLSENVQYDHDSLKHNHSHSYQSLDNIPRIINGPISGANGAYNALIYHSCVCEGYTRAMQYLLKLKNIKSHNVQCISGKDELHLSDNMQDKYRILNLPDDGYHSIICIDDVDCLYDDPCWNACLYQKGKRNMKWTLLTKEEISADHTLSFGEINIDNNTLKVSRDTIEMAQKRIQDYNEQSKKISTIIYQFAEIAGIKDQELCNRLIIQLSNKSANDAIDIILVYLKSLVKQKQLTLEQIRLKADLIIALNPQKYKTENDLMQRLEWLKEMNLENPQMSLTENHKLVLETFKQFNDLIGPNFDSFYTGGIIGYLATNHALERYHTDLDLLINEEQLPMLYQLVQQSDDFEFISRMNDKEKKGHEFEIIYKGGPMSIGLFLFNRNEKKEIVLKDYFYSIQNQEKKLMVNEEHLPEEYTSLVFSPIIRYYNGQPYRAQSLESIYSAKRNNRPKDRYDAQIIQHNVDMDIVRKIDDTKKSNYKIDNIPSSNLVVKQLDEIILAQKSNKNAQGKHL